MDNKVSFPELMELLANATGSSKKSCEAFLKELFSTIENALIAGEQVKIKDLGSFKVSKVEARKSVHVGTGEEIEIPEHNKIVFTPDKSLAESINSAFAEFETIEIDTEEMVGIIDSIQSPELGNSTDDNSSEANQHIDNQLADSLPPETNNSEEDMREEGTKHDNETELIATDIPQQTEAETNDGPITEAETPQNLPNPPVAEPEADKEVISCENTSATTETEDCIEQNQEEATFDLYTPKRPTYKAGFFWGTLTGIVASFIIVFIVAFTIGFPIVITKEITSAEYVAEPEPEVKNTVDTSQSYDTALIVKNTTISEPKRLDVKTDTVRRTRFLTTMAREYYGDYRFWVYIYDENKDKIDNPDKIKPGTVVVIPEAEKYAIDKGNPESIKRATDLAASIADRKH